MPKQVGQWRTKNSGASKAVERECFVSPLCMWRPRRLGNSGLGKQLCFCRGRCCRHRTPLPTWAWQRGLNADKRPCCCNEPQLVVAHGVFKPSATVSQDGLMESYVSLLSLWGILPPPWRQTPVLRCHVGVTWLLMGGWRSDFTLTKRLILELSLAIWFRIILDTASLRWICFKQNVRLKAETVVFSTVQVTCHDPKNCLRYFWWRNCPEGRLKNLISNNDHFISREDEQNGDPQCSYR